MGIDSIEERIKQLDYEWKEVHFRLNSEFIKTPLNKERVDLLRNEQEEINLEMKKMFEEINRYERILQMGRR